MSADPVPAGVEDAANPLLVEQVSYVAYDDTGRITVHGRMAGGVLQIARLEGHRMLPGEGQQATHYVDLSGDAPELRERPALDLPASLTATAGEEVTIAAVPAGPVRYAGPYNGSLSHPGGDLAIGFTIPGRYTLTIEPFPARRAEITLEVTA
ncbi:hypothetical protein [Methylobacterium nodulans]|uniref:Uncharacterized protein n=1 Tax=Methylobacterium nodulans (strain LMG 21967 / CNCM I-2342 / ORS 2060) TaxID=460265 RepID=B8IAI2_METNO|nr:hypothetical protein [Methylobacterium nodulans]ACL61027.1 hypothetical protein Mnod_6220 [Methylobacterium nodulans ORS 2060]